MSLIRFITSGTTELGGTQESVYTYDSDEEVDSSNAALVLEDFATFFFEVIITAMLDYIWDGFVFNSIRLERCIDVPEKTWESLGERLVNVTGLVGVGDPLPEFVAIRSQHGVSGPGRKGSKFLGGLLEAYYNAGAWATAMVTAMVEYALGVSEPFEGDLTGILFRPGIFRTAEGVGVGFLDFNDTVLVDMTASHQDRREAGIGI